MENSVKNLQKIKQRIAIRSRYTYAKEYYAALNKEGNQITSYNIDEPRRHYAKQKKLITKGQVLYDSTHILKLLVSILEDLHIFSFCSI